MTSVNTKEKEKFVVGAIVNDYKEIEVFADNSDEAEKIIKKKYGCNLVSVSAIPKQKVG